MSDLTDHLQQMATPENIGRLSSMPMAQPYIKMLLQSGGLMGLAGLADAHTGFSRIGKLMGGPNAAPPPAPGLPAPALPKPAAPAPPKPAAPATALTAPTTPVAAKPPTASSWKP